MQTALEKIGIDVRQGEQVRPGENVGNILDNDYNKNDEYSVTHKDALSDGDPQGKGTGHGGHTHSIPDHSKPSTMYDYSNIDTEKGGGQYDIEGRNGIGGRTFLKNISLYNENYQYGPGIIDTRANQADGQIVIGYK